MPSFGRRYKNLKVPMEAYKKLMELRQREIEKAKQEKDLDKLGMLTAMDSGTFTGYLICKIARDIVSVEG